MAKTENFCHFFWLSQKNAIPLHFGYKNQPMRQLKIIKSITNRESASLEKYLQEIGKEEMISAEEEAELAQRIRKGDQKALERLTRANLRFVVSVAKQYQNQGMSLPDLIKRDQRLQVHILRRMVDPSEHPPGHLGAEPHRQTTAEPGRVIQQDQP